MEEKIIIKSKLDELKNKVQILENGIMTQIKTIDEKNVVLLKTNSDKAFSAHRINDIFDYTNSSDFEKILEYAKELEAIALANKEIIQEQDKMIEMYFDSKAKITNKTGLLSTDDIFNDKTTKNEDNSLNEGLDEIFGNDTSLKTMK